MSKFFGGGDKAAKAAERQAREARQREAKRQADLKLGRSHIDSTFSQFNDAFFDQRRNDYMAFGLPQLDDSYQSARKNLIFALQRSGNLNSSAAGGRMRDLKTQYERNKQMLDQKAQGYANTARSDVENNRAQLIQMLSATVDPAAAAKDSASRAAIIAQPAPFDPFTAVFSDVTAGLADAAAARKARSEPTGVSLFTNSGGSGRVVN